MNRAIIAVAAVVLASAGSAGIAAGNVIYVDGGASGANNGTCWADAYVFLQDALSDANDSQKPVEIRVAQGVYRPDRSTAEPNGTGDREATFRLVNGVAILGGYAGFGEQDPNVRDIALYETVLSGDLDADDADVNDPAVLLEEPSRAENAYHVATDSGTDQSAVLDGFTISGGNADHPWTVSPHQKGGGMYNELAGHLFPDRGGPPRIEYAAMISNCTFVANSAIIGGGIYNYQAHLKISNCSFYGNSASHFCSYDVCWGGTGGGIHNAQSSPMLTNCVFRGNSAGAGGGMANDESHPVVNFCTFTGNSASGAYGGGMYGYWSSPRLNGCVFNKNSAASMGAGMANNGGMPLVADCTFSENSSIGSGGGIYNDQANSTITRCIFAANSCNGRGGGMSNSRSDAILTNCVFAGNQARRYGGAVSNSRCEPIMANCTIILNRAGEPGGGVSCRNESEGLLSNSILWGNSAPEGAQIAVDGRYEPATITVEYSTVMGGKEAVYVFEPNDSLDWGDGNIDCDPCFADLGYWDPNGTPEDANDDFWVMGDYHLQSQAGRWDVNTGGWTIDEVTSPCIDAGDPMTPIGLESFPNGGRINIGAYGGTPEASKSYFGESPCETIVAGDVNGDCKVNFLDFGIMAMHWMEQR